MMLYTGVCIVFVQWTSWLQSSVVIDDSHYILMCNITWNWEIVFFWWLECRIVKELTLGIWGMESIWTLNSLEQYYGTALLKQYFACGMSKTCLKDWTFINIWRVENLCATVLSSGYCRILPIVLPCHVLVVGTESLPILFFFKQEFVRVLQRLS